MSLAIPPGTFDVVPQSCKEPWKQASIWQYVERVCRKIANGYACQEVRTPIFERTELFCRSVGEETDIVNKEMYTFEDRGNRSLTLRPEGTASVMRSFITNKLQNLGAYHRLFYLGPMFRYERPQAGRYRQHHQFGVEVLGSDQEEQDAELLVLIYHLFEALGLQNVEFIVNHLGTDSERADYRSSLIQYLKKHEDKLSSDSQRRLQTNPLRILDSKDQADQQILELAPKIQHFLGEESSTSFNKIIKLLDNLKVPYKVDPHLVRGLDYYTGFVYEVKAGKLAAQSSLGGGGRYDGLLKSLGGPDLPSCGFAIGLERVIQTLLEQGNFEVPFQSSQVLIVPMGMRELEHGLSIASRVRKEGISCQLLMKPTKLKNGLKKASQNGNRFVLIIGQDEMEKEVYTLKDMQESNQVEVTLEQLVEHLARG